MLKVIWSLIKFVVRIAAIVSLLVVGLIGARTTYLPLARWVSETAPVRWLVGQFGSEPDLAYWYVTGRSEHDWKVTLAWFVVTLIFTAIVWVMRHWTPSWRPVRGTFWDGWLTRKLTAFFDAVARAGNRFWAFVLLPWWTYSLIGYLLGPLVLLSLRWVWPAAHHGVLALPGWLLEELLRPAAALVVYGVLFLIHVISTGTTP